jgi:phosphoribosyl-ATP pyrophosphohydrolase/phosphoribosyl-AMP cyclohydrolase
VEPLARRAVAQGRDVRQHAGGQGDPLRLRRRRAASARRTCFHRGELEPPAPHEALPALERTIAARAESAPAGSYTARLLADPPLIGEKVREEAEEVARAAREEGDERVAEEAADVLYHLAVLLRGRGLSLDDAEAVLSVRRR